MMQILVWFKCDGQPSVSRPGRPDPHGARFLLTTF